MKKQCLWCPFWYNAPFFHPLGDLGMFFILMQSPLPLIEYIIWRKTMSPSQAAQLWSIMWVSHDLVGAPFWFQFKESPSFDLWILISSYIHICDSMLIPSYNSHPPFCLGSQWTHLRLEFCCKFENQCVIYPWYHLINRKVCQPITI